MTDQPKWTPGPWRYDRTNGSPTTGEHMIAGAKPGYLAEVRDCGSGDVRANAHLIAAAPDMAEALEKALNFITNTESEMGETLPCGDAARAALAKARGETK
jgi:hypothetical protein